MRKAALPVAMLLAVLAAAFLGYAVATDRKVAPVAERPTPSPAIVRASRVGLAPEAAQARTTEPWGKRDDGAFRATRLTYETATDLKSTFETDLRTPENGGLYYARRIYLDCLALAAAIRSVDGAALAAPVEEQRKRCAGLGDEDSAQRLLGTLKTSAAERDPLYAVIAGAQSASLSNRYAEAVARDTTDAAIALGDPNVLQTVMLRNIEALAAFDGQRIDAALKGQLIAATAIAACQLGARCDGGATAMSCIWYDKCAASLADMALVSAEPSDADRARIFDLADRITAAAHDGTLASLFSGQRGS